MDAPPVVELKPEDVPEPVDGKIVLDQATAAKLARTIVALTGYIKISWARCADIEVKGS
jgi:hypothetical protein